RTLSSAVSLAAALLAAAAPAGGSAPSAAATGKPPAPTSAKPSAPAPLTNEDVVRLVVHGTDEEGILKEIATRPPAVDLDPGVVGERKNGGVRAGVIEAMRLRQGSVARPVPGAAGAASPSGSTPPPAAPPTGSLEIAFAPSADGKPVEIFAIATMPKGAPRP